MTAEEAYAHCRDVARREARNFYYGFRLLDGPRRDGIHAAYAFSRRCDDSVDGPEPHAWKVRELELRREELAACAAGRPAPEDPVSVALAAAIERFSIPVSRLGEIVDGVEMDLTHERYATFAELRTYCDRVAGAVGVVSIHVFGFTDPAAPGHAQSLGLAMQIVNIMRDVSEDAARGRIYLPQADLAAYGVGEDDLRASVPTEAFRRLMRVQAERARNHFAEGRKLLPMLDRRARMCVGTLAGLYGSILDEIERRDYDVLGARVGLSAPRKIREMARAAAAGVGPQ